jgi:hypothetical protein
MDNAIVIITIVYCFLTVVAFFIGILRKNWEPWDRICKIRGNHESNTKEKRMEDRTDRPPGKTIERSKTKESGKRPQDDFKE